MTSIQYENPPYEVTATRTRKPMCQNCRHSTGCVYCKDCNENYCKNCADYHKKFSATKHHNLVPSLNMRKEFSDKMEQLFDQLSKLCENEAEILTTIPKCGEHILKEMKKFRQSIYQFFDKKEEEFKTELAHFLEHEEKLQKDELKKCESFHEEITKLKTKFFKIEKESNDIFKDLKDMISNVNNFQEKLDKFVSNKQDSKYQFVKGTAYMKLLPAEKALGSIEKITVKPNTPLDMNRIILTDTDTTIATKIPEDKTACYVSGMTFLYPKTLILTDRKNLCIKAVDTTTGCVTKHLKVSSEPFDVAPTGLEQVAVTMPMDQKIKVLDTKGGLVSRGELKVSGTCFGIAATSDKLFVSYDASADGHGKVEILNHFGNVLQTVTSVRNPLHICVGTVNGKEQIYISDSVQKTITMISDLATSQGVELCKNISPTGLASLEEGSLLVCDKLNHQVLAIKATESNYVMLLKDTKHTPESVCYDTEHRLMYVSHAGDSNIHVYCV